MRRSTRAGLAAGIALVAASPASRPLDAAQASGLKIVIVEGEDAVNIIEQKTAVAPVVEVRDKNNQPVSGAIVRFAIRGGRASFNGARTLSVTTNAAGRAAVTGLTPNGNGAFQISASAAFQAQTAVATIAQTNVLTAAQAAAASGAGGTGGAGASVTKGHFNTTWSQSEVSRSCPASGGTQTHTTTFGGSLSGDTITGTFTVASSFVFPQQGIAQNGFPQTGGQITLHRQQ